MRTDKHRITTHTGMLMVFEDAQEAERFLIGYGGTYHAPRTQAPSKKRIIEQLLSVFS